jgi:O-succinylbenzoic acid--CoA ligase
MLNEVKHLGFAVRGLAKCQFVPLTHILTERPVPTMDMTPNPTSRLPNWLDTASRNYPDKLALEFGAERWTFSELRQQVISAASTLARSMPERQGRIGILSANRPGFVVAVHAAVHLGIPFVPLNWRLSDTELSWQIQNANITLLIADEARQATARTASAEQAVKVIPLEFFEQDSQKALPSPCAQNDRESDDPNATMFGVNEPLSRLDGRGVGVRDLADEAAIIYTSGTSGRPKGAILTYGNLWFSAIASALHLGHRSDDVWLATMPLFHIGGLAMLIRGVIGGVPVILHDRFDPDRAMRAIENGATLISLVPTMLERMLALQGDRPWPPHLRCILLGGSAAPAQLLENCRRQRLPIAPTYGLTEATSQVTTLLPDQVRQNESSSGRPLPLTELRITTPEGKAREGEIGEIEIRGPTLFAGYLGDSRTRTPDEWFATGDVGYLDAAGYLSVVDRRHDLIISGGENIYPAEIERILRTHPLVADAAVVGVPDETWGARPVAAVVWTGDPAVAEVELRRYCATEISGYKLPDRFWLMAELPRSSSGKLLRRALAEQVTAEPDAPAPPKAPLSRLRRERGVGGEGGPRATRSHPQRSPDPSQPRQDSHQECARSRQPARA